MVDSYHETQAEANARKAVLDSLYEDTSYTSVDTESRMAVRLAHRGNKCRRFTACFVNGSEYLFWYGSDADQTRAAAFVGAVSPDADGEFLAARDGETFDQLMERAEVEFSSWIATLPDFTEYVEITLNSDTQYKYLRICACDTEGGTGYSDVVSGNDMIISGFASVRPSAAPSAVTIEDRNIVPDSSVTPPEPLDSSLFTGSGNYPSSVSLTQQRLVWASSDNEPERIWMSQVGDFYTYNPHQIQVPDDPIDFVLPVTRFPKINHIVEMRKLLMFNAACEWLVDSSSSVSGLTYETIQAYAQSYSGSNARLKPLVCNNSVVFCERTGQSVRRFAWDLSADGFAGRDVSILSSSIFDQNPIVDWTYQQFPYSTIWCALTDGTAASFEYMEEQDIIAWATHRHGGGRFKCFATSYGIAPALDMVADSAAVARATHEEVFAIVQEGYEDASGTWVPTGLWLERMRVRSDPKDTVYHSLCMDSVRVLNALNNYFPQGWTQGETAVPPQCKDLRYMPSRTATGELIDRAKAVDLLEHNNSYIADHAEDIAQKKAEYISSHPTATEAEAYFYAISQLPMAELDNTNSIKAGSDGLVEIYEGYPYNADFMSVFPVIARGVVGAGQFDIKDIGNVGLRLMASYGGTVRAHGCRETEPVRYKDDPGAIKTPRFYGDGTAEFFDLDAANVKPVGINVRDGRFHVEQDKPWPFQLLMYELDVEAEVGRG